VAEKLPVVSSRGSAKQLRPCSRCSVLWPRSGRDPHLQTVKVAAQIARKRAFRIEPIHRAHGRPAFGDPGNRRRKA
jgi:hypothetical protein